MLSLPRICDVLLVLLFICTCGAQELLVNPSFENGVTGWKSDGFSIQIDSQNVHEGVASALCSGRTQSWHGPAQDVTLTQGNRYQFSSYIRIVDDLQGKGPQPVYVRVTSTFTNGTKSVLELTARIRVSPADDWVHIGGDFLYPKNPYTGSATLNVEGPAADISFYFDDSSLVELPEYTTWEEDANSQIEAHRKGNINFSADASCAALEESFLRPALLHLDTSICTQSSSLLKVQDLRNYCGGFEFPPDFVSFNVPANFAAKDLVVHIDHTRHLFGFGSLVRGDLILETDYEQYRQVAYRLFNWATVSDYTWTNDRGDQNQPDFSVAVSATNELTKNGLKVRGHALFSAIPGNEPAWVTPLTGQDLKDAVNNRIAYLTGATKGKISHWDVNNELLHGRFYEDKTSDPKYSQKIFQAVRAADPTPDLFLNDYDVVATGSRNLEYVDLINSFKDANVGLKGVGVQSHMETFTEPDVTLLKARLDRLAQTGVPLWITELSVGANDEHDKADWYEKILRLYFGHPSVEGISLWGFWDHDIDPLRAIVHGFTYTLDEAGKRYLRLLNQDWSTHEIRSLSTDTSFTVRGFQGDYAVVVYNKGKPIQRSTFTLGKTDATISIRITGDGSEITLPPVVDPFAPMDIEFATSSLNLQTIGHATSTSQAQNISCVTRLSPTSDVGDEKTASVSCNAGEVLTGCSSYTKNNDWHRDGEQVSFSGGKAVCTAFNGYYSTVGVQAIARCCTVRNLQCRYRTAGPSGTGERDQVVVPCAGAEYPVGCGTWTFEAESDGTIFTSQFCIGQNDDPKVGVYAFAACCQTPNLHCATFYSEFSGQNVGDKSIFRCPANEGFVLSGCNVYTPNGRAAGAYIEAINGVDSCVSVNGFQRYGVELGVQSIGGCVGPKGANTAVKLQTSDTTHSVLWTTSCYSQSLVQGLVAGDYERTQKKKNCLSDARLQTSRSI